MLITYNNGYTLAFLYIFGVLYTDSECGFSVLYTDSECVCFWHFKQTQNVFLSLLGSIEIPCMKYGPTYHSPLDYAPSSPPTLRGILPLYIWSLFYFHVFIDLFDAPVGNKCPKMAIYMSVGFLPVTTPWKKMSFLSRGTMNCLQTLVSACTLATIICLQVIRSSEHSRARLPPWQETYRPITQILCW